MKYLHFKVICFPSIRHTKPYSRKAVLPDRDIINSILFLIVSIALLPLLYMYFILIIHFSFSIVNLFKIMDIPTKGDPFGFPVIHFTFIFP